MEDAYRLACLPLLVAALCALVGLGLLAWLALFAAAFVAVFFRNPEREIPGDGSTVVAPADGKVVEVAEVEGADGRKAVRVGIFLSIFDVHVNRAPVAGRVVAIERSGEAFLAAYDPEAPGRNVRLDMTLETRSGERVGVAQITGLVARRIVCHPVVGEWVERGARYGLIRFGSRTDVTLPADTEIWVVKGQRVRGGSTALGRLPAREESP